MKDQEEMEKLHKQAHQMLEVMESKYLKDHPAESKVIIMNLKNCSREMNSIRLKIISGDTNE